MREAQPPSALVVLVPEAEALVGRFRAAHDPTAAAGMPAHITVLYPFLSPAQIDDAVLDEARACFRDFEPFSFELARISRFPGVVYLAPEPAAALKALTLQAWDRFPECPPYAGRYPDIVPHLSVASASDERLLDGVARAFGAAAEPHLPVRADVSEVVLMVNASERWAVVAACPLGAR
ncbi:MAG: 2'-5' RNA ligase family protein [Acetobacteraceae bacterium]|nr:2'-5' RNA ligase family protein [Acetobacteraceae bacterium]